MGPGGARNKGFENSYNNYVYFLDSDDYFIDNNALKNLYNLAEEKSLDVIDSIAYSDDNNARGNKRSYFLKREYLLSNNIRYKNMFFGEDYIFNYEVFN